MFLNLALAGGLAAVSIPILVHIAHRRKITPVKWGAMQFLELGRRTRRRIRLEEWLLLLLRMGMIGLVALALARPWAKGGLFSSLSHSTRRDVAIVIGANDVVNPVAQTDPESPIAGMPILNVHEARTVIMIKRSLSPGFAGIPNPLFAADNCLMLFGDGKQVLVDLVSALKE